MKGCVKVIISVMSNLMRTIKSLPLAAVLFTCVVILSSAAAFASEEFSPSSEVSSYLAPDNSSLVAKEIAEEVYDKLSSDTRSSYTIDDVYNILYGALRGQSRTSVYNLPRIATYLNRIEQWIATGTSDPTSASATITGLLSQINAQAQSTAYSVTGTGSMSTIRLWDLFYRLVPINNLGTNQFPLVYSPVGASSTFTLAELEFTIANTLTRHFSGNSGVYIDTLLNTIASNSYSTNTALSAINSSINSSHDITWSPFSDIAYYSVSLEVGGTALSSNTNSDSFTFAFSYWDDTQSFPQLLRFFIPITRVPLTFVTLDNVSVSAFYSRDSSSNYVQMDCPDYFLEYSDDGLYLYLFGFRPIDTGRYAFSFDFNDYTFTYLANSSCSVSSLNFNTYDYQLVKTAFYQAKSANAQGSMASDVKRLADYLADPDKIAAENASQGVIDDTLDGFTGSGSAAAKGSDIGSMKNISGSVQNGLDSGGSAGDAASVFTNANFWSWFTQSTSDGINNAYPAPVVEQRRGSGDEIPDFISGDHEELENYRNRRDRW